MSPVAALLSLAAVATSPGSHAGDYVAMGSSFAAGSGVGGSAASSGGRCARSTANYAQQAAVSLGLRLIDVSCSGATSEHLIGPWNELPPQIDAVTPATRLVTITIGGNDVGYIAGLGAAACGMLRPKRACPSGPVGQPDYVGLQQRLIGAVAAIRTRAPDANVVLVDYLALLPPHGSCARIPLLANDAAATRAKARRLNTAIAAAARQSGAMLLSAATLSARYHACAADPWVTGMVDVTGTVVEAVPLHPNGRGMAGLADALVSRLSRVVRPR